MSTHKNARTTPFGRALMVRRVLDEGWTAKAAAESAGVSVRTVRKWSARYRAEGTAGLADRSSRPHRPAGRHAEGWRQLIVRLRQLRLSSAAA